MKRFFRFILSIFVIFIFSASAFAENFYITDYKVGIMVADNGDMEVKEVIDTYFTNPSHGIYRNIPLSYNLVYSDGTQTKASAFISDVSVNEPYTTHGGNGDYNIKIGDPDTFITGPKKYVITYKYKPLIKSKGHEDEFYFNVIGTQWKVPIEKAAFKITMPKEFDAQKAGLSIGSYGTQGFEEGANLFSDGKSVWAYINRQLAPYEGVTVRIPLGENYYVQKENGTTPSTVVLILIVAFTGLSFIVWLIFGKDDPVIPVVNFYPPKDKNSAEIGAEYHGEAAAEEIVSLIIYLAAKGYIKIENPEGIFILHKLKEYDGNNTFEKDIMNMLFVKGDSVTKSELSISKSFNRECMELMNRLTKKTKLSVFDPKACTPSKIIIILICITAIIALTLYSTVYYSIDSIRQLLFAGDTWFLMSFIIIAAILFVTVWTKSRNWAGKIFITFWACGFGGMPLTMLILSNKNLFFAPDWKIIATGITGLIISIICLVNLPKRNRYGQIALGNISGLKKFIETAQKDEIERLANEHPGYCFEILPYAYVLGVSSVWINKIENIIDAYPSWYDGHLNSSSFKSLASSLNSVSSPSYSNGGHSGGGGGCSGGGGGGGGGGSW